MRMNRFATVTQEDELLALQKDVCMKFGVPWLPPKAKAGKPNRQAWGPRAIYEEVRAGSTLPNGVTAAVPCAWSPDDSLASTCSSDVEVFISHTENHLQTVSSPEDFMVFLDLKLNPAEELKDWIFVLDLASTHRAAEFRAKVPNHIDIVYIPAQSTSYCQPCDLAIFKTWKAVLADAASESLAESIVTGQNIKTAFDFSHALEEKKRHVGRL